MRAVPITIALLALILGIAALAQAHTNRVETEHECDVVSEVYEWPHSVVFRCAP